MYARVSRNDIINLCILLLTQIVCQLVNNMYVRGIPNLLHATLLSGDKYDTVLIKTL